MTVIFFAGPRLDHNDSGMASFNEADYLERLNARPPVVVRGYGVSGHPVSIIRAGERIADAEWATSADLVEYGFDPIDTRTYWIFPAWDAYGNATTGVFNQGETHLKELPPPFSFRPQGVIPMPNGWLFCMAAPLLDTRDIALNGTVTPFIPSGVFREYFRVYHRNGDWIQDFPALHGGPIHDAYWDNAGNCFVAGDEVGEDCYSFRKYNSAYELQWSVSFNDYWPLSTVEVRTDTASFVLYRAQFGQRRASVKIEPKDDGSFYVISELSTSYGYQIPPGFRYYERHKYFALIARVSASGVITWVRVLESRGSGEPDRKRFQCKAIGDKLLLFYRGRYISDNMPFGEFPATTDAPGRYSVGVVGGDYSWDYFYQVYKTGSQWSYQEVFNNYNVDRVDFQNGWIIDEDGDLDGYLFPSAPIVTASFYNSNGVLVEVKIDPETLIDGLMTYANERLTVFAKRYRWINLNSEYNIDPEYLQYVFYKDLTLLSVIEWPAFNYYQQIVTAEDGSTYYNERLIQGYGPALLGGSLRIMYCADHFKSIDAAGDPQWNTITATAQLGVNEYGKPWRDYGIIRNNTDAFLPSGSTQAEYQAAHDDFVVQTTAHDETASGDLTGFPGEAVGMDFWQAATDIVIAYHSPTPTLALPVFLQRPSLIGPITSWPPGLALSFALSAPVLRREYVGPLAAQVYRLMLGDVEIPFSTLIVRKTAFEAIISAICPAPSEPLMAAILDRDSDPLTVWRGVRFMDGADQWDLLLSGALAGIRYDRGAGSCSLTLDVRQEPTATPARTRPLAAISRREAQSWSSPLPDIYLNPGDTATVGAISFIVGTVEYRINPNDAQMIVQEEGV